MDYLKKNPSIIYNYYHPNIRDYNYSSLNQLAEYNINIEPVYHYFNSVELYKLKNIWNYIFSCWIKMHQSLRDNKKYKTSKYSIKHHEYIHSMIDDERFDALLTHFIQDDIALCLFVMNCILSSSIP